MAGMGGRGARTRAGDAIIGASLFVTLAWLIALVMSR